MSWLHLTKHSPILLGHICSHCKKTVLAHGHIHVETELPIHFGMREEAAQEAEQTVHAAIEAALHQIAACKADRTVLEQNVPLQKHRFTHAAIYGFDSVCPHCKLHEPWQLPSHPVRLTDIPAESFPTAFSTTKDAADWCRAVHGSLLPDCAVEDPSTDMRVREYYHRGFRRIVREYPVDPDNVEDTFFARKDNHTLSIQMRVSLLFGVILYFAGALSVQIAGDWGPFWGAMALLTAAVVMGFFSLHRPENRPKAAAAYFVSTLTIVLFAAALFCAAMGLKLFLRDGTGGFLMLLSLLAIAAIGSALELLSKRLSRPIPRAFHLLLFAAITLPALYEFPMVLLVAPFFALVYRLLKKLPHTAHPTLGKALLFTAAALLIILTTALQLAGISLTV